MSPTTRAILHVDMDAFFASIAMLDRPELRGKAVLTGGSGPRAVVTTASYEARRYGCRSAMPMAVARRLCPHAIVAQVPGERIRAFSEQVLDVLHRYTPQVEPVSVDEAYLDVTGSLRLFGDAEGIARRLKQEIYERTRLTASVGVAFNKFLAKLASDMDKPDGLRVIRPGDFEDVLLPLPLDRLWGVGPKTAERLKAAGFARVGDLRKLSEERLVARFGEVGRDFHRLAHGLDDREVVPDHQAKSLGQEQTFDRDVAEREHVRRVLLSQAEHVARRLRRHGLLAGGVGVKIRFGEFQTITRHRTLDRPTDVTDELWEAAAAAYDGWAREAFQPVRLIGVAADRLKPAGEQMDLFPDAAREKKQKLDRALDRIADRFGEQAVRRAVGRKPSGPPDSSSDPRLEGL